MGRKMKIKASYDEDARYMLRLKAAVERDERDPEFKKSVSLQLQNLATRLIAGPTIVSEQ